MGDTKAFTTEFNVRDNFSRSYDAIMKRMSNITNKVIPINFEINKGITGNLDAIQKKCEANNMAAMGWNNALGRAALGAKNAADATKNIGNETQKTTGFLGNMQSKLDGVSGIADKVRDKFGAITGLLAGGSVAGMAWLKASDSMSYADAVYEKLSRKKVDAKWLKAFVDKAGETGGVTTSGSRLRIADNILTRTSLRGEQTEDATTALEKIWYKKGSYLKDKYGVTSADDLSDILTKKTLGRGDKQMLGDLKITGSGATSRTRSAIKLASGEGYDWKALVKEDPYPAFLNKLSSLSTNMGKALIEPMNMVLEKVNGILDLVNTIPGAPGLIALAAVLTGAAGGASILLAVLQPLGGALKGLKLAESLGGIKKFFSGGSLLAGGPIVALLALAAILLIVAYKTGVLQKAWDKFQQSAIGKDIMSGLQGLANFAGTLIDRFSKWYEDSGKNQMLSAFFTLVEVLGNAWDYVDKIYSTMRGGGASPILAGLTAMASLPLALGAGILKTASGGKGDPAELLGYLIEQDQRWISYLITNFPLFGKIYEIIKKVHSVMEWLYAMLQGALAWIRDGLGITKKEKEAKFEKTSMSIAEAHDKKVPYVWTTTEAGGSGWYPKGTVYTTGGVRPNEGLSDAEITRLNKAREAVEKAPKGFFEGIPGITDLTTALQNLLGPINNLIDAMKLKTPETPAYQANYPTSSEAQTDTKGLLSGTPAGPNSHIIHSADRTSFVNTATEGEYAGEEGVYDPNENGGLGGYRIIKRTASARSVVTSGQAASNKAGGNTYNVQVTNSNDFSGTKISSSVDADKLLKKVTKMVESGSVSAVKKAIGQGRT